MKNNILKQDEVLEDLCLDDLKIIQNKNLYRFTSDSVILANFVKAKQTDQFLDIGTGSGIIAILAVHKNKINSAVGVELQPNLANMASRSVMLNGLADNIKIVCQDIKDFTKDAFNESFDVITCNPPYKKAGIGKVNDTLSKSIARHEIKITLSEICVCVKKLLKFGGKFYACIDADRTAELIFELKKNGLEPKKMFFSQSSTKTNANIVFIMAVKGGRQGVRVLQPLITNDKDGNYLESVRKMRF